MDKTKTMQHRINHNTKNKQTKIPKKYIYKHWYENNKVACILMFNNEL